MEHKATLTFLGTGSAFTVGSDNYHSNMLLASNGNRLLIDCGSDVRLSAYEQGIDFNQINDVYISHLHADHAGGLEWLGFNRKFNSNKAKPVLHIQESLIKPLWENVLSGGMSSLEGSNAELDDFFDVNVVQDEFVWEGLKCTLVRTHHYCTNQQLAPSFGLFIMSHGFKIFITTDTKFTPELLEKYYQEADLIFHDCEITKKPSGVHAHYNQLKTLDKSIKAKMWLYHYNSPHTPDAKSDGFLGFVQKGQQFILAK